MANNIRINQDAHKTQQKGIPKPSNVERASEAKRKKSSNDADQGSVNEWLAWLQSSTTNAQMRDVGSANINRDSSKKSHDKAYELGLDSSDTDGIEHSSRAKPPVATEDHYDRYDRSSSSFMDHVSEAALYAEKRFETQRIERQEDRHKEEITEKEHDATEQIIAVAVAGAKPMPVLGGLPTISATPQPILPTPAQANTTLSVDQKTIIDLINDHVKKAIIEDLLRPGHSITLALESSMMPGVGDITISLNSRVLDVSINMASMVQQIEESSELMMTSEFIKTSAQDLADSLLKNHNLAMVKIRTKYTDSETTTQFDSEQS